MINMDKIDRVMEITDASYDEVRQALIDHDGDVDQAILALLRKKKASKNPPGTTKPAKRRMMISKSKKNTKSTKIPIRSKRQPSPMTSSTASRNSGSAATPAH